MSISADEITEMERLRQRLDRWFALRWRAVLTWVVLAGLSGTVLDTHAYEWAFEKIYGPCQELIRRLGIALPGGTEYFVRICNVFALFTWFQPVALRLNLTRGMLWLVACVISGFSVIAVCEGILWRSSSSGVVLVLILTVGPAVAGLALIGWRSRPWMAVVASVLAAIILGLLVRWNVEKGSGPAWLALVSVNLPYAFVMIYGTKPRTR